MALRWAFLLLVSRVYTSIATEVKPIEKVIDLIEGMVKEVEDEGKEEAKTYDKFACFCKDTTKKKSDSVIKGNDNIDDLSAEIADKTQGRKDDLTEYSKRKSHKEMLVKDLDETIARCAKEKAIYETTNADLSKAISSLKGAIKAMKDSKTPAASLLAVKDVVQTLPHSAWARISKPSQRVAASLLQQKVDPSDPEYGFHSNDIIDLCEQLLTQFTDEKKTVDTEYGKTDKGCIETKASIKGEMKTNQEAIDALGKDVETLAKEIAEAREKLVQADGDLKDDKLYLKDLTARCEDRANDYDQRSQMRNDELGALTSALDILKNNVKDADKANERAFFLQEGSPTTAQKTVSFLQGSLVKQHTQHFLAKAQTYTSAELEAKKGRALALLRSEGRRIGSMTIASLTVRVAADPFKKVKGLIQKLIERLLEESKAEATKKGFCDEALGAAKHDRDSRYEEATDLSREIAKLHAKEDELTEEIDVLGKDIKSETIDLKEASEDRDKEKDDNMLTMKTATEGLEAVTEALQVLKSFYSSAAKASAVLLQASPVDEDTAGAGFSGSYKGKQGGMKAVFGLLEVIQSDFDRTLRTTEKAEAKAHREFVEFMQTSKASIAGKTTKEELDQQDLKVTRTAIKKGYADLQSNVDLLDDALRELEVLKPSCIDTGMSYKERVQKREDEIAALGKALCILDTDKVESECA